MNKMMNNKMFNDNKYIKVNEEDIIENQEVDDLSDEIEILLETEEKSVKMPLTPSPTPSESSLNGAPRKWKKVPFTHGSTSPSKSFQSFQPKNLTKDFQGNKQTNLYSKFCQNLINNGICTYSGCTFAHTIEQYSPLKCKFNCSNHRCNFWHQWEGIRDYISRSNIQVPERIAFESVIEKAKNYGTEQILNYKDKPSTSQIKLETSLQNMSRDVAYLHRVGYKNINLLLVDELVNSKFTVDMVTDYVDFINLSWNILKFENISKLTEEDRFKMYFYLPNISKYVKEIRVVNGDVHQVNGDILGDINGWEFVTKIGEHCDKFLSGKKYQIRSLHLEDYQPGVSVEMSIIVDLF